MLTSQDVAVKSKASLISKKSVTIAMNPNAAKIAIRVEDGDPDLLKPAILIINAFGLENCQGYRNA